MKLTVKELRRIINEIIRRKGNKWLLYTKDGKRVLGTHKTKKDAIDQEVAISYSKKEKK